MKFLLEFKREVVTHDGYSIEIEAADLPAAQAEAERMASEMDHNCPDEATETGPVECDSWYVEGVTAVTAAVPSCASGTIPAPANDTLPDEESETLSMTQEIWEGLLRAAQIGLPTLGLEDRAAVAAVALLKTHVQTRGDKRYATPMR